MKLFLISQTDNNNYETYDSAVVAAESEESARLIHPSGDYTYGMWADGPDNDPYESPKMQWGCKGKQGYVFVAGEGSWVSPEHVTVELIGDAAPGQTAGVICASFNAG